MTPTTGERVRWLREQRGWTPGQLLIHAQTAISQRGRPGEFSRTTLYRIERDERRPETHILIALADALETSCDFLLGRTADPAPSTVGALPVPAPDCVPLVERLNSLTPDQRRPITQALDALLSALTAPEAPPKRKQAAVRQELSGGPVGPPSHS